LSTAHPAVLVVDDEPSIRKFLNATLSSHGYAVLEAVNGTDGLALAASRQPDIVLLDLGLPDIDGLEVARRLRSWSQMPIIVLSARGEERDKVAALDLGADDYLTKPFGVRELLARLRVALRHAAVAEPAAAHPYFRADGLEVDLTAHRVLVDEREVHLTPLEFDLLAALVRHAGQVRSLSQLLREVWGPQYDTEVHYVRLYMSQLRRKIEADPARPRFIRTEPGVGYRLLAG
jgi:two-component system KDP operon response regulator KdpE